MSDDELDQEWKPSKARPQSTMARSFSLALNDLFKIDNSLADLDAAVSEKKRAVSNQTSELEALEARLRATEERLKKAASTGASPAKSSSSGRSSPRSRPALGGDTFAPSPTKEASPTSPLSSEFRHTSRPNTSERPASGREGRPTSGWKQEAHPSYTAPPMPGAMPPTPNDTPSASEGESDSDYVVIGQERKSADVGEDGDMPPPPPPQK
ncbi:hypothetical protein BGZ57DRAFT_339369 [Hyaloscypha finlandica]|nr:hypothetical protein F5882DRAFT_468811 [Hyaloscypha sp. PMI_1271]KAH8778924.1 hypothetical protein BGZ57DRAFT_339369 [Hyaloscypha finlandica]